MRKIPKINLMRKKEVVEPAPTVATQKTTPLFDTSNRGMKLQELKRNYETIQKANAIYYPVAYQFLRELGQGRQGAVYLGLRQGARGCITEHAIKLFDPELYHSSEEYWTDMGRIASQISRLQRIQSPNLVARHSYEETYGIGYIQMEAIDGLDLRLLLKGEHLKLARETSTDEEWNKFTSTLFNLDGNYISLRPGLVVYILRSVMRGLESLHEMNFLHCDIKPGNIMIDRFGSIKIVDFGRAVVTGEKLSFLLGSPMYMAPETHRRQAGNAQTDFYSVGLVGIEILTGKRLSPKANVSEEELLDIKLKLTDHFDDLLSPKVLEHNYLPFILRKLLAPLPENRYRTAKEADAGHEGLIVADKQFAKAGAETEYARILSDYMAKLVDPKTQRIESVHTPDNTGTCYITTQLR